MSSPSLFVNVLPVYLHCGLGRTPTTTQRHRLQLQRQRSTGLQKQRLVFRSLQHAALVVVVGHRLRILNRTLTLLTMTTVFLLTLPRLCKLINLRTQNISLAGVLWITGSNVVYARKQCELSILFILSSFASQIYGPNTSLTTRRSHLQNAPGHPEAYIAAVEQYGFANRLPAELARQVAENRALSQNRIPFSMNTFTEQLVKVFVANDLVC
jgi:hypothetical protein